jgi:enoyl-[acyl-carrier protein] reductase I
MLLLQDKVALVAGVANHRSIAWGISKALAGAGARLILTAQERVKATVEELAASLPDAIVLQMDVQRDDEIDAAFAEVERRYGGLDILVHSIGYAAAKLEGRYIDTTREGFLLALDISAYSFTALARRAEPLMERRGGGAMLTLTYLGSERVFPNYNVMGVAKAALEASVRYLAWDLGAKNIRVNAISSGPQRTLAARGIADFNLMWEQMKTSAPLRRNVEQDEVGQAALFLCSPMASAITGHILFVDAGYHVMGMSFGPKKASGAEGATD